MRRPFITLGSLLTLAGFVAAAVPGLSARAGEGEEPVAGDRALGAYPYDRFETVEDCNDCHVDISRQNEQAMMAQSFTHPWDEIEYFELALPHSEKEPKVAGIKAGCNGCHAPLAFLAGDIPPQRPAAGTRANEGVTCDVCHTITGFAGEVPFNFNYISEPGDIKWGPRPGMESPYHDIGVSEFLQTAEFCGTCHNEKDPWGQWVKATHLEWQESPQAKAGIVCQDCHMPPSAGEGAMNQGTHPDVRQHLFHGAHDPGKLAGVIEVRIHPDRRKVAARNEVKLTAVVMNAKAGHMVPTGSAEERVVWLHVEAVDAAGKHYHLPVDAKGFEGEEYTIASSAALAYQDIGDIRGIDGFRGLPRDGEVPDGDRIYRLPYLDPQGRMTIAQWNTASFGPDYRLAPLAARTETFTWAIPEGVARGPMTVTAEVYYSRLVRSVAEYLKVPAEESAPVRVNVHRTTFEVIG